MPTKPENLMKPKSPGQHEAPQPQTGEHFLNMFLELEDIQLGSHIKVVVLAAMAAFAQYREHHPLSTSSQTPPSETAQDWEDVFTMWPYAREFAELTTAREAFSWVWHEINSGTALRSSGMGTPPDNEREICLLRRFMAAYERVDSIEYNRTNGEALWSVAADVVKFLAALTSGMAKEPTISIANNELLEHALLCMDRSCKICAEQLAKIRKAFGRTQSEEPTK